MKSGVSFAIIASVVYIASTTKISLSEIEKYLPFLKVYEPPSCKENEIYKTCSGQCSDCTHRGKCEIRQCESKCDCLPRFFRLTPGGPCVSVAYCPIPECGENEVFRACGPICEKCSTRECQVLNCDYRCYCKEGFLRNSDGVCIPRGECPKRLTCSHNEEWLESGPTEEFCFYGEDAVLTNDTQNKAQCYCKAGFKKNSLGICIPEILCSLMKCLGVEIYHKCIRKCDTTCRNYGNPNCTEDENCYPGCFCPPGYVMNDFRSCIPIEKCPNLTQTTTVEPPNVDDGSPNKATTAVPSFVGPQNGSENLGSDAIENPGSDAIEKPGSDAIENPGADAIEKPGSDAIEKPGSDATENPGSDGTVNSESDETENPGLDGTENPTTDGNSDYSASDSLTEETSVNGVTSPADDVTNSNDSSAISDSDETTNSGTEEVSA